MQRDKSISADTRRTPHQVLKAQQERNKLTELRREAHQWALEQLVNPTNTASAEAIARDVSQNANIQVLGNTIQKMRQNGSSGYVGQGRKMAVSDKDMKVLSDGVMGWITIGQLNGDPEKKILT